MSVWGSNLRWIVMSTLPMLCLLSLFSFANGMAASNQRVVERWEFDVTYGFTDFMIIGVDHYGDTYRVEGNGLFVSRGDFGTDEYSWQLLFESDPPPAALHRTADGRLLVSTVRDRFSPHAEGALWLSEDDGGTWMRVLDFPSGSAIFWSFAESPETGQLWVGEYGYTGLAMSANARRLFTSLDGGLIWDLVWEAPKQSGLHLHRLAIDTFDSQRLWLSIGDWPHSDVRYSDDGGRSWTVITTDSQATAFFFTEKYVYFGRDRSPFGIFRWHRDSGEMEFVLDLSAKGYDVGPIYMIVADSDGHLYAGTIRYEDEDGQATLWVSADGEAWHLLDRVANGPGYYRLYGPDRGGYIVGRYGGHGDQRQAVRLRALRRK